MDEYEHIKGYDNLYKINRGGSIYSCWYKKEMKPIVSDWGYHYVTLKKEGKTEKSFIHRLLAKQYIDNPDNKPEVDHIDRNKINNSLSNLRWVTRIENRNNRDDIISNLTEEQLTERTNKMREYKRIWAEKNRRAKGITPMSELNKTKDPEYYNNKAKEYKAKEDAETKAERLRLRREKYKTTPQTEDQKQRARERAKQQRLHKNTITINN